TSRKRRIGLSSAKLYGVQSNGAGTEYHKIQPVDRMLEETYRAEARHFWFQGFRRFVRPLLTRATAGLSHPRLLDCGSGTGANLPFLGKFGTAFGIDVTWSGLEFARRRGVPRLARATVARLPFLPGTIDVAVSFDVLYCLP